MDKRALEILAVLLILLAISAATTTAVFFITQPSTKEIRVACVGDSLTESTNYPYLLWMMLGLKDYSLRNFGAGSTTISLNTETPYLQTEAFQKAMDFQPNIVVIMLGTNDAQPNLRPNNATLTQDYIKLIRAFQALPSKPEIWIALPPPIFSNQTNVMDSQYFSQTVIPCIRPAANQTGLHLIDVYSAMLGHPEYYKEDGIHVNDAGAGIMATTVYRALSRQSGKESYSLSILDSTPFFKA